ncbi:hypothetical protein A7981_00980 [Methylovorus sp. MM2]|uniref:hypothetical protein n=1 Tax=Methylovorus sp. MM2 TaxID=1848038 RepID=UPI0007E0A8BF|nr:hypothetical protein [Methylovorus sp. MM2]OAM52094.1 hypothetical protein A7981_00980 [Methylovorus sp. MM2]
MLENTGTIAASTHNTLNAQDITNVNGIISAGQNLAIETVSLSGDGRLLAGGDADILLDSDYTQTSTGTRHTYSSVLVAQISR